MPGPEVRRWADGTVTVVSLREQEEDRILLVRLADASARIRLPAHGVWTGRPEEAVHPVPAGMQEAVSFGSAGYLLSGANFLRCPLPKADPCFRFSVQEPLSGIRILARTNVHPVSVSLDGALLSFPEPAGDLPDGFRQLYSASLPLSLAKGEHILRAESGEPDSRFLPSALLQGFFETAPDGALKPFSGEAGIGPLTSIPGYTGSYFRNLDDTEIPAASCLILCLDPGLSPCELFVDGVSLGRRCWPPYEWEIPPALQGQTADITLVLTTSILPLFGNTAPLDAEKPYPYWVKVRGGKYQTCGLLSVPVWKKAP